MIYDAEYRCLRCQHVYKVRQGDFGCPPGYQAPDPDSPCGRSQRRYRCSQCQADTDCLRCGHHMVKWLNYETLFGGIDKPT